MRLFSSEPTEGYSAEFGNSDTTQIALSFSVEGPSAVQATVTVQAFIGGEWVDAFSRTASGSLRALAGGVYNVQAQSFRLSLTALQGQVTANVTTVSADSGFSDSDLSAVSMALPVTDGGSYSVPATPKELILLLEGPTPVDTFTVNIGSLWRDRQSLLIRTDVDIANLIVAGSSVIDNPQTMLLKGGCVIFIRLNANFVSRVI